MDLHAFRKATTLDIFCMTVPYEEYNPSPTFRKMVADHPWLKTVSLEDVEVFKNYYGLPYKLQTLAMMVHSVFRENESKDETKEHHMVSFLAFSLSMVVLSI